MKDDKHEFAKLMIVIVALVIVSGVVVMTI